MKNTKIDATQGPLLRLMIAYAIPLVISTVVQKLFNAVDIAVLGNMADSTAVAAVGATTSIVNLAVICFTGLGNGIKVVLARLVGEKNEERVRKTSDTSLLLALFIGAVLAIICVVFAPDFLRMVKCPSHCFNQAVLYLRVYLAALPAIAVYNFGSAIITSAGDTQRPLYYIMAGGVLNVVLNVLLCLVLPQKVLAVAIATAASQVLGAILVCARLSRIKGIGHVDLLKMRWDFFATKQVFRYGLPMMFAHLLFPIADLQMLSSINEYDVAAVAGNSAAINVESIVSAFVTSISATVVVFIGQNLGARKYDRAKKSFWYALWLAAGVGLVLGLVGSLCARQILPIFIKNDALALEYGVMRAQFMLIYWLVAIDSILERAIQAYGATVYSSVVSATCVFGWRIFWVHFIYPHFHTFSNLVHCYMSSWVLMFPMVAIGFAVVVHRYRKSEAQRNVPKEAAVEQSDAALREQPQMK